MFARTPEPPYVAVLFTNRRTTQDDEGYGRAATRMDELVTRQPGFLGVESVRDPATRVGLTVSYWVDEAAALAWRAVAEHAAVREVGRARWYEHYELRVATVTRALTWDAGGA